jgi:hypothetical protein
MNTFATSTVAMLCYDKLTGIEFTSLTSDLANALWAGQLGAVDIRAQYDDFMIFDLPSVRICLAHTDFGSGRTETNRARREGILVSVGSHSNTAANDQMFVNRDALREALVNRIEAVRSPEEVILMSRDEIFTEEGFDALIDDLSHVATSGSDWDESDWAEDGAEASVALPTGIELNEMVRDTDTLLDTRSTGDIEAEATALFQFSPFARDTRASVQPDLEERLDQECQRRARLVIPEENRKPKTADMADEAQTASVAAKEQADIVTELMAQPVTKSVQASRETELLRAALYPEGPTDPIWEDNKSSDQLLHRISIHAMNAFVLAFALPLGATMMTLAVLGRESWAMSARATAVAGAATGLTQPEFTASLLAMIN